MNNLKKQLEVDFSYTPFHSKKDIVFFKDSEPTKLLCKNKGWSTVGNYFVRFEIWSRFTHETPKLIPSYGG